MQDQPVEAVAVALKHRVRPQCVHLEDGECAIIIEYIQEDFAALPDGSYGEQKGSSTKHKKVKVKRDILDSNVDEVLEELLSKSKWMKCISGDIRSKLIELQQRGAQAGGAKGAVRKAGVDDSVASEGKDVATAGKLSKSKDEGRHRRREGGKKHHRSRVEKISSAQLPIWVAPQCTFFRPMHEQQK